MLNVLGLINLQYNTIVQRKTRTKTNIVKQCKRDIYHEQFLYKLKHNIEIPKKKMISEFSIYRKVKRLSDGKIYDSVKIAAKDNAVGLNQIYDHCNGLKEQQKFIYIYEEKVQSMAENFKNYGI